MTDAFDTLETLMQQRWTCRAFRPDPVPPADLERLLGLAQRTPSWCNTQPWQVVITSGAGTERFRAALADAVASQPMITDLPFPGEYAGIYRDRRRACGFQLYDSVGISKDDTTARAEQMLRNFSFFDAPHVAIVTTEAALGPYGAVDCGLYVSTVLLAAQSLGIATAAQAALASYAPVVREHFGIPDTRQVVLGISVGYPDLDNPVNGFRTSRARLGDVLTWSDR